MNHRTPPDTGGRGAGAPKPRINLLERPPPGHIEGLTERYRAAWRWRRARHREARRRWNNLSVDQRAAVLGRRFPSVLHLLREIEGLYLNDAVRVDPGGEALHLNGPVREYRILAARASVKRAELATWWTEFRSRRRPADERSRAIEAAVLGLDQPAARAGLLVELAELYSELANGAILLELFPNVEPDAPPGESSGIGDGVEQDARPLTPSERKVLRAMRRLDKGHLVTVAEIAEAMHGQERLCEETVRKCVAKLVRWKLAERPAGPKGGVRLSAPGRKYAVKFAG